MSELIARIRKALNDRNLSASRASIDAKLSRRFVADLLEGRKRTLTIENAERLAAVLDCSPAYLAFGRGDKDSVRIQNQTQRSRVEEPGEERASTQGSGPFIKQWREFRGLTQEKVADALGLPSKGYVSQLENGKRRYNQDHIERLAKLFECEPADILSVNPRASSLNRLNRHGYGPANTRNRIQQRLCELGLSARAASLRAGFGTHYLQKYFANPRHSLLVDNLRALAVVLETTPEWLISGVTNSEQHRDLDAIMKMWASIQEKDTATVRRIVACFVEEEAKGNEN